MILDGTTSFIVDLKRQTNDTYSVEDKGATVKLGDTLYYKLELTTDRTDISMYPQDCFAVSSTTSNAVNDKYSLIEGR